jgi:hypothetical protein
MRAEPSRNFNQALQQLLRQDSRELSALKTLWHKVESAERVRRLEIDRLIPPDDPIRKPIDLLGPTNRYSDENLHTRILAYLLDPAKPHGLGKRNLKELLSWARRSGAQAGEMLKLLDRAKSISVVAEYRHKISGETDRSHARCDLWIVIEEPEQSGLIIVENKIDALEGHRQLEWYENKARRWHSEQVKRGAKADVLLLYLAPSDRTIISSVEKKWSHITYLNLAALLRVVWKETENGDGKVWLGLYLSSVLKGILGFSPDRLEDIAVSDMEIYLGQTE